MTTALPTLTLSAIYVLYDACRRERRRRQQLRVERAIPAMPTWHEFVVPPPDEGDVGVESRLTVFTYLTRR